MDNDGLYVMTKPLNAGNCISHFTNNAKNVFY